MCHRWLSSECFHSMGWVTWATCDHWSFFIPSTGQARGTGLVHTLGGAESRPMPALATVPRSPFVPRAAQPPYSHVENCPNTETDRLRLAALRAMVDLEAYGSIVFGDDPSDDEPPSLSSPSLSEDDDLSTTRTRVKKIRRKGRATAMTDAAPRRLRLSLPQKLW